MKNVDDILKAVKEALAGGQLVLLTDRTVTREVVQVEFTSRGWGAEKESLDLLITDGFGNKRWVQIQVNLPYTDDLDGFSLNVLDGTMYIAPDEFFM